ADKAVLRPPGTAGHPQGSGTFARLAKQLLHILSRHAGFELSEVFLRDGVASDQKQRTCNQCEIAQRHTKPPVFNVRNLRLRCRYELGANWLKGFRTITQGNEQSDG